MNTKGFNAKFVRRQWRLIPKIMCRLPGYFRWSWDGRDEISSTIEVGMVPELQICQCNMRLVGCRQHHRSTHDGSYKMC